MIAIAQAVLLAWPLAVVALFALLPTRHAILSAYVLGLCFLPEEIRFQVRGLPDYNKTLAITVLPAVAALLTNSDWVGHVRLRWYDAPMLCLCLCPILTTVANNQPTWECVSAISDLVLIWGLPYLIGRLYFRDVETIRLVAIYMVVAGVIYMPLMWYELRMAPTLHGDIYGLAPSMFVHHVRWGGYRPTVFFNGGLALAAWSTFVAIVAIGLWLSRSIGRVWGVPFGYVSALLVVTAVLCKSIYMIGLLLVGLTVLAVCRYRPTRLVLAIVVLTPPTYIIARQGFSVAVDPVVELAEQYTSEQRVRSLETRLRTEELVVERAMQKPLFGHGRGQAFLSDVKRDGKMFIVTDEGMVRIIPDAFWVSVVAHWGSVGLAAVMMVFLLPAGVWLVRVPPGVWLTPELASTFALIVAVTLQMWNYLLNAHYNPYLLLIAGSAAGVTGDLARRVKAIRRAKYLEQHAEHIDTDANADADTDTAVPNAQARPYRGP